MLRNEFQLLPEFSSELEEIRKNGINQSLLYKIIQKHIPNSNYNKQLYKRYMAINGGVPIFDRQPRYKEDDPINNKVNNDFFSEIVDFKVGYFAGEPISYSYNKTEEAADETGGDKAVDEAAKALTDFITRNNMYGVDMETTKNASIYGYSGRLFYIDTYGDERVMAVPGYETIILSDTDISEPEYAIRYYKCQGINSDEYWIVEFYDNIYVSTYKGQLMSLELVETKIHTFDYCPLQGVANNAEYIGDAEKVISLIDDYDKTVSDNSNEIESFAHALMVTRIPGKDVESTIKRANSSGILNIPPVGTGQTSEPVGWVTKNINDTFTENHLQRLEDNIYRFSKTPNLNDDAFGTASGVSLRFKLHGLETKCSAFEANVMNSAQHMWRVLSSSWKKRNVIVDPLQISMEFNRNFPLDRLSEAQTAQAFISTGLPKRWVYSQISGIDDVEYIMQLIEDEKSDVTSLYENTDVDQTEDKATDKELNDAESGEAKINLLNGAQIQALTGIVQSYTKGDLSRNAAITIAVSSLGISRENAESIIEERISAKS